MPVGSAATGPGDLTLADAGRAMAVIVLPDAPLPAEATAARELAEHLERVTGAAFDIRREGDAVEGARILVGPSAAARKLLGGETVDALGDEESIVRRIGNDLLLVGGRPRGTLYAVYDFLEHDVGVRWLSWRLRDSTFIPSRQTLSVAAPDRRRRPVFEVRDMHGLAGGGEHMLPFLVRNRSQGPSLKRFVFFDRDTSVPDPKHPYGGTSHSYIQFPPDPWHGTRGTDRAPFHIARDAFETRPEYFTYDRAAGRRVPKQYCHSNPEVRRIVTDRILGRFAETDGQGILMYSAADEPGPMCECDDCMVLIEREETPGGAFFDFLAELAGILSATYPDAIVGTLAYRTEQTEKPPRHLRFGSNVLIRFAPVVACQFAPLNHPVNAEHLDNLFAWQETAERIWVWYYPQPYFLPILLGNLWRVHADLRTFRDAGVSGFYIEQTTSYSRSALQHADIQTWIITKLMEDPDRPLDDLIDDFCRHYYGPAGEYLKTYFRQLDAATRAFADTLPDRRVRKGLSTVGAHRLVSAALLAGVQQLLDTAEAAVADEPLLLERVREVRLVVDFTSIALWDRLDLAQVLEIERSALLDRYETRFARNIRSIFSHPAPFLADLASLMAWQRAKRPLGPLPEPLADIPAERIRQLPPESAWLVPRWRSATLVPDPRAAGGYAVQGDVTGQPFSVGYYDEIGRIQHGIHIPPEEAGTDYRLYRLGTAPLASRGYVWLDRSWGTNFGETYDLHDPDNPDVRWDFWASLRFEGPAYGPGPESAEAEKNRFLVDRIVLVQSADEPYALPNGAPVDDEQPEFDLAAPE